MIYPEITLPKLLVTCYLTACARLTAQPFLVSRRSACGGKVPARQLFVGPPLSGPSTVVCSSTSGVNYAIFQKASAGADAVHDRPLRFSYVGVCTKPAARRTSTSTSYGLQGNVSIVGAPTRATTISKVCSAAKNCCVRFVLQPCDGGFGGSMLCGIGRKESWLRSA